MKKNIISVAFSTILLFLCACERQDEKLELAKRVNLNTCDDTKEIVEKYANTVLPLIGGLVVDKVIPESVKNGIFCECTTPSVQIFLAETYTKEELEEMLSNAKKRKSAIKKTMAGYGKTILKCYKEKGNKGVKWVEKLLKSIEKL